MTTYSPSRDIVSLDIKQIPEGTTVLDLNGCKELTTLPDKLPDGITELYLFECEKLKELPTLPTSLRKLNLNGCKELIPTPHLLSQLAELEQRDCEVTYPAHINDNSQSAQIKDSLKTAYAAINITVDESHAAELPPTYQLLHRYLNESIDQRGGTKEIINAVNPLIEFITKNPTTLSWIDKISSGYLEACVNQPVKGFSEICAWISVAKAESIPNKIEAARQLVALDTLTGFVARLGVTQVIEVEAGNAFLREVHKKLLENNNITQPWIGVGKGVAYERMIHNHLTADNIQMAHTTVTTAMTGKDPKAMADYLCEKAHQMTWAEVAFPKMVEKFLNQSAEQKKALLEDIAGLGDGDERIVELGRQNTDLETKTIEQILLESKRLTLEGLEAMPAAKVVPIKSEKVGKGGCGPCVIS